MPNSCPECGADLAPGEQRRDKFDLFMALDALPDTVIPYIRQALANFQSGEFFAEFGK